MNKQIMITVSPKEVLNILNGKAVLLLRKYIPKDFKGWVNIYVKKDRPYLCKNYKNTYEIVKRTTKGVIEKNWNYSILNDKVVSRFWFDKYYLIEVDSEQFKGITKSTCMTIDEITNYCNGNDLYAWVIYKLEIFDKPKELSDFYSSNLYATMETINKMNDEDRKHYQIKQAPKKYIYVWEKE